MNAAKTNAPFEPLGDFRAQLGESPVWSPVHDAVWWVDIIGCRLLRTNLKGDAQDWATPEIPGFVQCTVVGIFVGMQSGIFRFDPDAGSFEKAAQINLNNQRFNDACTDTRGRIWAGTMDIDNALDNGVLYLFEPDGFALTQKLDGFRTINGLAWDQQNQRLFYSDSHPSVQTVWTVNVNSNDEFSAPCVFAKFDDLKGRPDGATLDADGNYWIAGVGGGEIYRFDSNGALDAEITVPVQSPTKPAFIGDQQDTMVLTSFADTDVGGRIAIWRDMNTNQESNVE